MFSLPRIITSVLILAILVLPIHSQTPQSRQPTGSIAGRVSIDDHPARAVTVLLLPSENGPVDKATSKATTDNDGNFQITGIPAGSYIIQAFAPAMIGGSSFGRQGQVINLIEGESVDGVEVTLKPGGVVTGRITEADGRPIIQENVRLIMMTENAQKQPVYLPYSYMFPTDDRGVYRLFGVPPGKYLVAVGNDFNSTNSRLGNTYYHPDTSDESKANIIEVTAGTELSNVDIVLARPSKTYEAFGKIVDALTGKPVAGMLYGYGVHDPRSEMIRMTSNSNSTSNTRGEFRILGISPGSYSAFATPGGDSDLYSDAAPFAVTDSDVSGLVVKVHRGSVISGNVILEPGAGQPSNQRLSDVQLSFFSSSMNVAPRSGLVRIAPDGSFRIVGLPRGITRLNFQPWSSPRGLALTRIERDGVEQKEGIEVGADEEISGVKLFFAYGSGIIKGIVKVEGGEITPGTFMILMVKPMGKNATVNNGSRQPDARGRFLIAGLIPGQYELTLNFQTRRSSPAPGVPPIISKRVTQVVSVTNDTESEVTLIVDLNEKDRQ